MDDFWDDSNKRRARPGRARVWLVRIGAGVALAAFAGMVAWGALSLMQEGKATRKQVVQIAILKPPPPPPPPPPPENKPPPEPEVKQEVERPAPDEPKQADEAPPPGEQLKLEGAATGAGDGFGLGAGSGRDITTIGGGGGGNRAQHQWFAGQVQAYLQEQLQKNEKLRSADYRLVLKVWLHPDGTIDRYELVNGSGNPEIDRNLKVAMDGMGRVRQAPPPDLPQPIRLRVTSRGAG
jgi:protein TonB